MINLFDMVDSWHHFNEYNFVKDKLKQKDTKERVMLYLKALDVIPFHWEDCVTSVIHITTEQLELMSQGLSLIKGEVEISINAKPMECLVVSEQDQRENPSLKRYIGFAESGELSNSEWHFHAFCVKPDGVILEPTPIIRNRYYGIKIP